MSKRHVIFLAIAAIIIITTASLFTWYATVRPEPKIQAAQHRVEEIYEGNSAGIRLQYTGYIASNVRLKTKLIERDLKQFNSHFYNLAAERRWLLHTGQRNKESRHKIIMPAGDLNLLKRVTKNPQRWASNEMTREFKHQPPMDEDQLVIATLDIRTFHRSQVLLAVGAFMALASIIAISIAIIAWTERQEQK